MDFQARGATPATSESRARFQRFWFVMRVLLIGGLFVLGTTLLLLFPTLNQQALYDLDAGDIVPEDIRAPGDVTYVSDIQTERARGVAANSVEDIYDNPDPRVGREQVRLMSRIMAFITDVRADPYADTELKHTYLQAVEALTISRDHATALLQMSDNQFGLVARETVGLIEDAMSGTVQEGNLRDVTASLELKVSPSMPESLIPVTLAVSREMVVPNSVLNVEATEEARRQAVEAVEPVQRTFREGEIIVRAGERLDEEHLEALRALGLASQQVTWRDAASALLVSLVSVVLLTVYLGTFRPGWLNDPGRMLLIILLVLAFLTAAEIMVPAGSQAAYLFPAAAPVLALVALVGLEFAALVAIVQGLLIGYLSGGSLALAAYAIVSALLAAASLRRTTRLNAYFLAGLAAAAGGVAVLLVFELPANPDPTRMLQMMLLAGINGLLSAGLALIILFVVGNVTGMTTSLKLLDLMRPDHPLQRQLQQGALGTYQHTLSVANVAETAAEAIGADSLLTRVGTLYHDIGKLRNPGFFVENRTDGAPDPHQGLSPLASAQIIKAHVTDGLDMARRHRLPPRILEFIAEHHGSMPILFFLHQAREEAQASSATFDEDSFYYDGPIPQSRETAILMLADGCESATRANRPTTGEEIEEIVTRIIQQRLDAHQLDDSGLTLTDIKVIRESITRTLKGMYHPRVRYPTDRRPGEIEAGRTPAALPSGAPEDVSAPSKADIEVVDEALEEAARRAGSEAARSREAEEGD